MKLPYKSYCNQETLEFTPEIKDRSFKITLYGQNQIYIENFKYIVDFSKEKILIKGYKNVLELEGEDMCIAYYSQKELKVCGKFLNLKYCK